MLGTRTSDHRGTVPLTLPGATDPVDKLRRTHARGGVPLARGVVPEQGERLVVRLRRFFDFQSVCDNGGPLRQQT